MGSFFSRAYKRLTLGNQQRSRNDSQSDQQADPSRDGKRLARSLVESIPVGQSIDSAEYRDLEGNKNVLCLRQTEVVGKENDCNRKAIKEEEKKKDVEEAVIKIQALVRGHLARKALKDANQAPNGLGQSQFDEESLTKNLGELRQQPRNDAGRARLESIAEIVETSGGQQTAEELAEQVMRQAEQDIAGLGRAEGSGGGGGGGSSSSSRHKLASICRPEADKQADDSAAKSWIDSSLGESRDSAVSPAPSEAAASIDLNTCDTPASVSASASIDILDHNIQPTDRLATVLHQPKSDRQLARLPVELLASADGPQDERTCTPDSLESEEAAAIRIQSAFRGYRTRKNSPYRTRSPPSSSSMNGTGIGGDGAGATGNGSDKRDAILRQQDAVVLDDDERLAKAEESILAGGRRQSRSNQRDPVEASGRESISDDQEQPEDTGSVREVPMQQQQNVAGPTELAGQQEEATDEISLANSEPAPAGNDLSAALEAAPNSASLVLDALPVRQQTPTSFDTDESVLGAALSLNEEKSRAGESGADSVDHEDITIGLESEARRLVEELELELEDMRGHEEEEEEAGANQPAVSLGQTGEAGDKLINVAEQLAIELESDDIERRDPRGQASEERARSPQISAELEPLELALEEERQLEQEQEDRTHERPQSIDDGARQEDDGTSEETVEPTGSGSRLEASRSGSDRAPNSGRSSPANGSSNGDDESDADQANGGARDSSRQQPQGAQSPGGGPSANRNKKRNRNKRRNKK